MARPLSARTTSPWPTTFYSARGDTTKAGYFDNSITQSGLDKDIYDVLYGTLAQNYGDYYMFWEQDVYKDAYFDWAGDQMTDLFTGLASDGQYVYPHQSKVVAIEPMFREFTKHVGYARLLWAMLQLVKGRKDDTVMPDPTMAVQGIADFVQTGVIQPYVPHTNIITLAADVQGLWNYNRFSLSQTCTLTNGSAVLTGLSDTTKLFPGTAVTGSASIPTTTIKTVDSASQVTVWDNATATGSVSLVFHVAGGMPGASSEVVNPSWAGAVPGFNHDTGRGSSFATAVYLAFASVYGYGLGKTSWKLHADEAARVLCDVVWGVSPNATDKAHIEGVEITRPNHTGGTLVAWTEGSTVASAFEGAEKTPLEKYLDDGSVYEFRIPLTVPWAAGYPVVSLTNLKQKRQEPEISPTNMEGTVLAWMALRIYNAYKNNRAYPAGTWGNGLGFGGGGYGYANGKVVNSSGAAISDAFVVIVDGSTSAAPSALTNYMDIVYTDSNGEWVAKFGGSGTKTIYVIKDSYKYYRQVYSFAQADQNVTFTDITMEAM